MGIWYLVLCFILIASVCAYIGHEVLYIIFPNVPFTAAFDGLVSFSTSALIVSCLILLLYFVR